jgi:hypothetical protein
MERVFAAINGGVLTNTFVGDDDFVALVRPDHDDVVEITNLSPRPGVAWTVHPEGYRPPMPAEGVWEWDDAAQEWVDLTSAEEQ